MAKYSYVELKIKNGELIGFDALSDGVQRKLTQGDVIYIYRSTTKNKVYIGQTIHFIDRNHQHFDGNEEKFNVANFNMVIVLYSQLFNGSALDDVENQLITYFTADNPRSRNQSVQYDSDDIINLTKGNTITEYRDREKVASDVVLPFWEDILYPKGWVKSKTIDELRSNELVKYSPIKILTDQQQDFIDDIINHPNQSYVINGDAGTGKTVLLTHLVAKLFNDNEHIRVGVVVQPNWEATAREIFKVYGLMNKNLTIATSTKLITKQEQYDTIIVDESHKLSRRFGKQHPSFNSVYNIPEFSKYQSHLEILEKLGNQVVLMYDVLQTIRPANITRSEFQRLTTDFEKKYLSTQFRIQAPEGKSYTSDDYINGIKYLLYKDTGLLEYTNFNPNFDRSVFQDDTQDAYFGYVDDHPLHNLFDWIDEDLNLCPEHVDRVLAGLVEPWQQKDGKDVNKTHWHEDGLDLRWNSTQENWINSKEDDAQTQIGSVFAVQGIDLNKVGVIIGRDLEVDDEGKLFGNSANFYNTNGKFSKADFEIDQNQHEFTIFVLNIYYVLMTRGIDGIRLGFWHNDAFKKYLQATLDC